VLTVPMNIFQIGGIAWSHDELWYGRSVSSPEWACARSPPIQNVWERGPTIEAKNARDEPNF